MEPLIAYAVHDRVATITLNRPEKRNALNYDLVAELSRTLDESAADDGVRVVVLTGAGEAFSAGADLEALRSLQDATAEENERDSRHVAEVFTRIYLHPRPVIARVNGHAVAGGCGLAAACDFAVAVDEARLGFTEVRIGFVPAIVSVFLLRKMREAAVRDLLLRGRLITASEAVRFGLITSAVPKEDLDDEIGRLCAEIVENTSGTAVAVTKGLLAHVRGMGLSEAVDHAVHVNALARGTADCREGIRAFLTGEDPAWKSRA